MTYLIASLLWFFAIDKILVLAGLTPAQLIRISIVKGSLFVILTTWLFYRLIAALRGRVHEDSRRNKANSQELFQKTAERLKAILENAPMGILVTDLQGRLLEINAAALALLGYTAAELSAMTFVDYTHPEDIARNFELLRRLKDGKLQSYDLEKRLIRKNGQVIWGRVVVSKLGLDQVITIIEDTTERKQMEEQLQATAKRLRAIMERAPVGIDLADFEGHYLETNPAMEQITGYSAEELKTLTFYDITHPEDCDGNRELATQLRDGKRQSYEMEKRYIRKDGRTIWVRVASSRVDAEHTMGIVEDITERKEAAAQLEATAERLQAILERAPVGIVVTDREGNLQEYNATHLRMCGSSPAELRGTNFREFTHPDDLAKNIDLFGQVASGELPSVEIEKRFVRKDGQVIWVRLISSALNKDSIIGIAEDITARKQAEQQLRATADRLRAILDHAPVGINIVHRDSHISETNAAYQRITGYTAEELTGTSFKTLTHPDDLSKNIEWFEAFNSSGSTTSELEKRYIRKDGRTIWVRLVNSKLGDEHCISIVEDITERKEAEERLRSTATRLQAILENAPVGIVSCNREDRFEETNAAFQRMTGFTGEQLRQMDWRALTHPDDLETNASYVEGLMSGDLPSYDFEKRYLLKGGKSIWVRVVGSRLDAEHKISIIEDITERKEAQARLRATAERLQAILEHAPVGINIVDPRTGRIIESNAAYQRIIGYSAEELRGMTIEDYTHPDDLPHNLTLLDGLNKGSWAHYELEKRYLHKDGRTIWVRVRRSRLKDDLSIGIIEDVTDRKQAVEQLRRSEARFRNLIEASIMGVLIGSSEGSVSYANDAFLAMTGYTRDELTGLNWRDLTPPEYQPLVSQNLDDIRRTGRFRPYEKEYFRKDGSRVPVMVGGALTETGDTVTFIVDLTERKVQQLELERLARIVESADDAIIALSLDGVILSWNEGAQRLFGYTKAEMIGASENILLPAESAAEGEAVRKVVTSGKGIDHFRALRVTKTGELKPVGLTLSPVTDALGQIIGISKIARDRTQIIKAEQLEEQLRQAQKLESLGRLAGGVAHDFNNLLMVISSYGEMLQDRLVLDEKAQKYTQQILKASERAAGLSQQMLAFSRKQVLAPRILDMNATVEDTAKMVKRLIGEDIQLIFNPGKPLASIEADPSQITQVLLNLCVNARDAMPQGGTITLATADAEVDASMASRHPGLTPGKYIMLTVTDTGVGMSREVQERIFEPFYTTKPTGQGTGLGLSTVYGIVKQSNGYIWVYSEPNRGTSFKLYFPITEKQAAQAKPANTRKRKGQGETILVVEDEEALRNSVCEHLQGNGYRVLEARDGQDALDLAKDHAGPIDVLLTDVIMPVLSGPETAARLLKLPERKQMVTIYMSGYPADAIINHGVSQGRVALIQKPFSLATLTEKVQELLAAKHNGAGENSATL